MPYQPYPEFMAGGSTPRVPFYTNTEYTQNLYFESPDLGANPRSGGLLLSTPGLQAQSFLTFPETGPIYALATISGATLTYNDPYTVLPQITYAVVGRSGGYHQLYRINNNGTSPTNLGNLPFTAANGLCRIVAGNQDLTVIATGSPSKYGATYSFSTLGGVVILSPDSTAPSGLTAQTVQNVVGFQTPIDGDYMDGYYMFGKASSEIWFINSGAAFTYNPLDFAVESDQPDSITALRAVNGRVWVFSRSRMLAWYDSGAAGFPFVRDNSSRVDVGCITANALSKMNNTLFWLGRDPQGAAIVYRLNGYIPERISTQSEEQQWQNYLTVDDAVSWTYQEEGHWFYVLSFPTADTTFVFDDKERKWHRRSFTFGSTQVRHIGQNHTFNSIIGGHIVGDRGTAQCYLMSRRFPTDIGTSIVRQRTAPHFYSTGQRTFHRGFRLDASTLGSQLRYSNDFGTTYTAYRNPDVAGADRSEWLRLGSARTDRVYDLQLIDTLSPVILSGAYLDVEGESI
jgi:hypothetical protein